jgi:hypothetical protein
VALAIHQVCAAPGELNNDLWMRWMVIGQGRLHRGWMKIIGGKSEGLDAIDAVGASLLPFMGIGTQKPKPILRVDIEGQQMLGGGALA